MRRRRAGIASVLLIAAVTAGCGGGAAVSDLGVVVKGAKGATVPVELRSGQRFSLAVPDDRSAGDSWTLEALPDATVASFISKEARRDDARGVTYFVFNAKRPGTSTIRLYDCWRCGGATTPPTEESRLRSGEAIFDLTVSPR
ncbi:protease inhibitor I42 family protein [Nonomuraea roseoviolacea]|uniref:Secreted protein n=1 Tax=Nonomuraea roseoviolacea subsp. carminata TaxID=160689 RepID=A0ABT1KAB7_9ACTN|nr:protease inhibitor I42 family protein [Nonomuraea roseoviolacea]MCP2350331.1 putative secreted protein [Nonomuraea roseoviolacea subsp. carminata]